MPGLVLPALLSAAVLGLRHSSFAALGLPASLFVAVLGQLQTASAELAGCAGFGSYSAAFVSSEQLAEGLPATPVDEMVGMD